jgi:hypothetical protein
MEHLLNAQKKIKEDYGERFFDYYASEYANPYLGEVNWKALIDTKYPIENLNLADEYNDWSGFNNLKEALAINNDPIISLSAIIDTFVWLLNAYGAQITILDKKEDIPMICNWTCPGFETVGYGYYD